MLLERVDAVEQWSAADVGCHLILWSGDADGDVFALSGKEVAECLLVALDIDDILACCALLESERSLAVDDSDGVEGHCEVGLTTRCEEFFDRE